MTDYSEFESISPYPDEEAVAALHAVAYNPLIAKCSKYLFEDLPENFLGDLISHVTSVNDFQVMVMTKVVRRIQEKTMSDFTYEGVDNLRRAHALLMSNHRDIILDPALLQVILYENGLPCSEIAVGDNLIQNDLLEAIIRSNRMVKVVRGVSSRELYLCSQLLSRYIRLKVTGGESSVWIAQRQGRTKDGSDLTEQGLLKMLDLSGEGSFEENFKALNITPISVSYEYEPCDILKARELYISRDHKYVKAPGEDIASIIFGITQWKGGVHISIGRPLTDAEIAFAALCDKHDRYQYIRHAVDMRVIEGYRLWKTNFIAFDILNRTRAFRDRYTAEERKAFIDYMNGRLDSVNDPEIDREELKGIFLSIYANPIVSKKFLQMSI